MMKLKACLDHRLDPSKLQTGGVVGIAEITDCVQKHRKGLWGRMVSFSKNAEVSHCENGQARWAFEMRRHGY
jgi:hypothetical protein